MHGHTYAILLPLCETLVLFFTMALVLSQRRHIGLVSFYILGGVLALFGNFTTTSELSVTLFGNYEFSIGATTYFLPLLASYLMLYAVTNVLETQRFIIGYAAFAGLTLYLAVVTRLQFSWNDYSYSTALSAVALDSLLNTDREIVLIGAVCHIFDLFLVPIIFTRLHNAKFSLFPCCWIALSSAFVLNYPALFIAKYGLTLPERGVNLAIGNAIVWVVFSGIISSLLAFYLYKLDRGMMYKPKVFEILFSFLGGYRKAKELEKDVADWEGRYKTILQNAKSAIMIFDAEGVIVDANLTAERIFNPTRRGNIIGKPLPKKIRLELPPGVVMFPSPSRERSFRCELIYRENDKLVLDATMLPIKHSGRRLCAFIARDITDEIQLYEKQANSQRLETIGTLAGGIAHEFNVHVHEIINRVNAAKINCQDANTAAALEDINSIAQQAAELPHNLLGFAKQSDNQLQRVSLVKVLNESFEFLPANRLKDLEITAEAPEGDWEVFADSAQLRQTLVNMLLNAIEALEKKPFPRTLKIAIGEAENSGFSFTPPPRIATARSKDFLYLSITDNGCGMDSETQKRIFEPFFTTKAPGLGVGMGLPIAYGNMSRFGGWIEFASDTGSGSMFYLYLPKAINDVTNE